MAVSPLYPGSLLLLAFSDQFGVRLDHLNLFLCLLTALILGVFMRLVLPPNKVPAGLRSLFCLVSGLGLVYFVIGWAVWHLLVQATVCYVMMTYLAGSRHIGLAVLCYAMGHLLLVYLYYFYIPLDQICYNQIAPLMMSTQRITSLAFSLRDWGSIHDGGDDNKIHPERKKWALKEIPSYLNYMSYVLSFQGILVGPFCHFSEFIVFIHGRDMRKKEDRTCALEYMDHPPTVWKVVFGKLATSVVFMVITAVVTPMFPFRRNGDPEFIASTSLPLRLAHVYVSSVLINIVYYTPWTLADAACNASGMGYTGQDTNGHHDWTGMSNVHPWEIEAATSVKVGTESWNIGTVRWLRHVCFTRAATPSLGLPLTLGLSAVWHGLYIGYHLAFLSLGLLVVVGRKVRRSVTPSFQTSTHLRVFYGLLSWVVTRMYVTFAMSPFYLLVWPAIFRFHSSFYWAFHASLLFLYAVLPSKASSQRVEK